MEGTMPDETFQVQNLSIYTVGLGLQLGVAYAFIALIVMRANVFQKLPVRVEKIVRDMKLTFWDCLFLSICAGVGEELLFRSGFQFYLGPLITSVIFVAIHGYLNPFNWRMSLYGLVVLPFILIISYGFIEYGLWFAISAHFSYDLILFTSMSDD
jgi:membrane protease YdiL (CAAX protease family)